MLNKDQALCIRTVDFSETSQIATFFTKDSGKISVIAKGSRRRKSPFDGPLEIFSFGHIVFTEHHAGSLGTLTDFEQKPAFMHLVANLCSLNSALFAAELINLLTEEYDPDPELFCSLVQFLDDVQQAKDKGKTLSLLILFQLNILTHIGLGLVLDQCANCKMDIKNSVGVYFSDDANGFVCRDCEQNFYNKTPLSANVVDCLMDLEKLAAADEQTLQAIEKILVMHFTHTLGKPPKMAKHFWGRA